MKLCMSLDFTAAHLRRYLGAIATTLGAFLVFAGVLTVSEQMPAVASWLFQAFPTLGWIG